MNDSSDDRHDPTGTDAALDGLLREYARTGHCDDDEPLVRNIMQSVSALSEASRAATQGSVGIERDWPWLFGKRFWKTVTIACMLCTAVLGTNLWLISHAEADPTEVLLLARDRFAPGDDANVRVLVRDGARQVPLADARVLLRLIGDGRDEQIAEVTTGPDGIADITAVLNEQLEEGSYTFRVEVDAVTGGASSEQQIRVARSFRTMVSTDKPIYRPGQTMHLRALSLSVDDMTPAAGRPVKFTIRDGKGNKVFAASPITSAFGIAAADFMLAEQLNEGDYTVAATIGDTRSERTVKVQQYVLPGFSVGLETDQSYYHAGDNVQININATYTFGQPAAGAEVRIEAAEASAGRNVFANLTGVIDEQGHFSSSFALDRAFAGTAANGGDAEIFITCSVTDRTGETNSVTESRIVANRPIRIEVYPESGELIAGVENTVYVLTAYPDGKPAQTTVTTDRGIRLTTSEAGIGKFTLTPANSSLELNLTATDGGGLRSETVRTVPIGSASDGILLRTDRALYREGETIEIVVLSASPISRAFVDVIREGRSMTTVAVDLDSTGKGRYQLDLPADAIGPLTVQAYCIYTSGMIARDSRLIQVRRNDQLTVTATLDAEHYRPAEEAVIKFLVQSRDGSPVQAALSLAVVDEAVFALNSSRPGLEEMFFIMQQELLEPRYQFMAGPRFDAVDESDAEFADARIVQFSAAATSEAGPREATGTSLRSRRRTLVQQQRQKYDSMLELLGWAPLTACVLLTLILSSYILSRIHYEPGPIEPSVVRRFRSELRQLFWVTLAAVPAIPIVGLAISLFGGLRMRSRLLIAFCVVTALTVVIARLTVRTRRFLAQHGFGSLCRRILPLIPCVYLLANMAFLGGLLAEQLSSGVRLRAGIPQLLIVSLACLSLMLGSLGFLRRVLTEIRSWQRNLASLVCHQVTVLIPLLGISFLLSSIGQNASVDAAFPDSAAFPTDSRIEGLDFALRENASDGFDTTQNALRIRRYFPETLLWSPQLITDPDGKASLTLSLADSITTWRLAASAVSRSGQLGSLEKPIRVFQDFFVDIRSPQRMTRGDEIVLPVSVFNYLAEPQSVTIQLNSSEWFEFTDGESSRTLAIGGKRMTRVDFRIRALLAGTHKLTVTATGPTLSDGIERSVEVIPDGVQREFVQNVILNGQQKHSVRIPEEALDGGRDLFIKLYPRVTSQVLEGMDAILRMPHGCFEQTSSSNYPNVLLLDYMRRTKQSNPAIELQASDYMSKGYQRLLTFECEEGGFDWFGRPPGKTSLTAYGLHQFTDMARVYDVDPGLLKRTRAWLLSQMDANGTWAPSLRPHQEFIQDPAEQQSAVENRTFKHTAYIVWALAAGGNIDGLDQSIRYLELSASQSSDPYPVALAANAFIACGRTTAAKEAIERLMEWQLRDEDFVFWNSSGSGLTYSLGNSLTVETTALVAQAIAKLGGHPKELSASIAWLIAQRNPRGMWHSTHASVQAMRALLTAESEGGPKSGTTVTAQVEGHSSKSVRFDDDNAGAMHLISFREAARKGDMHLMFDVDTDSRIACQIITKYYMANDPAPQEKERVLEIVSDYGRRELDVNDMLTVQLSLRYHRTTAAPMTMVDLGIPPGFEIDIRSLQDLVATGVISHFEIRGQQASLYFEQIPGSGQVTRLSYRLRARYPVRVRTPANIVYQYYEPEIRAVSRREELVIRDRRN